MTTSEAQYFDEERFSEAELRRNLNDSLCEKKIDAMKHVLAAVSVGRDAGALFPDVVKNIVTGSLELKKLVYIYLVLYAEGNRDLALLSVNSFQKDLTAQSQLVRASALRAMASIKVLEIIQLVMMAVQKAATDGSAYVRKTAAQCMVKVYSVDPDQFGELRDLLLRLINDHEVSVVGSAVIAFHSICIATPPKLPAEESEPAGDGEDAKESKDGFMDPEKALEHHLALLHPLYKRLCQDVLLMDSWAQQHCIDLMLRYCRIFFANPLKAKAVVSEAAEGEQEGGGANAPAVSEDFQLFLNSLKLLLNSSSIGVSLAAASALCYLAPPTELPQVVTPLLRCLVRAPDEATHTLMLQLLPLIKAHPELFRAWIREFFVKSFEAPKVKKLKLEILEVLCDESNVQLILKEMQCYAHWHSQPIFIAEVVQTITKVALKEKSVTDHCLRGLVKMLDSKCVALSSEAVVALRALLHHRQEAGEKGGLGNVISHLVSSFEDLKAATARASVIWIIGQYQHEVSFLAPDVVRKLVKSFSTEATEVKQQAILLSVRVWAFHALNAKTKAADAPAPTGEPDRSKPMAPEWSATIVDRCEQMCDYVMEISGLDENWDVRDMSRGLKVIKAAAKQSLTEAGPAGSLTDFGSAFSKACVRGAKFGGEDKLGVLPARPIQAEKKAQGSESGEGLTCQYTLYSMAHILDFAFETYSPLPKFAVESSPDSVREVPKHQWQASSKHDEPKSLSSANMGNQQHMEQRVVNPSNITNLPKAECLEDLDLFYSDEPEPAAAAPLDQMGTAPAPGAPVGTAVFGEDDESDEDDAKSDDDDDLKYLQQATPQS